uniref:Reverse transcriptase Ty1/copia-type domain-containing protein n=1 Tax=Solanum lycopersicum TaxID=4081 RepID=A0A3Q7H862_SOLLC
MDAEVIDTPIPDYETDNATNTEVYPDENVAHPIMQYEDNTITLIETEVDEVPTTTNIPTHNQPKGAEIVIILVYVDNFLITGSDTQMITEVKENLHRQFKLKDLGELKFFLGLPGAKPASTPIEPNVRLTSLEYDLANCHTADEVLQDITDYQRVVGKLLYATITRPDISYTVQNLSQFMQSPKKTHWEAAIRLIKYLKGTVGQRVWLQSKPAGTLSCWCDSDWTACPNTRRSITRYVVNFEDSLVLWKSKKQQTISRSLAVSEVNWL